VNWQHEVPKESVRDDDNVSVLTQDFDVLEQELLKIDSDLNINKRSQSIERESIAERLRSATKRSSMNPQMQI
jgi:hypothetical protein